MSQLRVLVFGAGAIGTYVGGSLALAGQQVVFLERPDQIASLSSQGLRLRLVGIERRVPEVEAAGSLSEALAKGPFDAAVLAVKSFDTAEIARQLQQHKGTLPPIISLQNGVENESTLAEALGADMVIPGTVTTSVGRRGLGDVAVERLRGIGLGGAHPLVPALVELLNTAGLQARAYPDGVAMKWSKMLTNLLANASSAILDMTPAEIYAHAGIYALEVAQVREALAVMDALRLKVTDLPGTPVSLLAFALKNLPPLVSRPLVAKAVGGGRGAKMPSFHIDLHSGRGRTEVEYLNGAVVRAGDRLGVPTPANRLLTSTLLQLTNGSLQHDDYRRQPFRLLADWDGATLSEA